MKTVCSIYIQRRSALLIALSLIGCIGKPQNPAATQPVTVTNVATTQPSYWYDQPASATVVVSNLDSLIDACKSTARRFGFKVDRADYRTGLVSSQPRISSQFFEFWESDVRTPADSAMASVRTTRRTLRFEIAKRDDGRYEVAPKALIERLAQAEQRITSVALFHGAFAHVSSHERQRGTKESDEEIEIPSKYWYAAGRDSALEKAIAQSIRKRLR
jgi:hypothetical protein